MSSSDFPNSSKPEKGYFYAITETPVKVSDAAPDRSAVFSVIGREVRWSGPDLPKIGDRVHVTMNGLGPGTVRAYFIEDRWLGIEVAIDTNPEWRRAQGVSRNALVFGAEILAAWHPAT